MCGGNCSSAAIADVGGKVAAPYLNCSSPTVGTQARAEDVLPATGAAARLAPAYNAGMESGLCANCQTLQRRVHDLQAENERLRRQLDEATRAGSCGVPTRWRRRRGERFV